jgi:hypothetical protein
VQRSIVNVAVACGIFLVATRLEAHAPIAVWPCGWVWLGGVLAGAVASHR